MNDYGIFRNSNKLMKIAKHANQLSWFVITLFILGFVSEIFYIATTPYELIIITQKRPILYIATVVFGEVESLIVGISVWLILKGISLAFKVLVKIAVNVGKYQGVSISEDKENMNFHYHPEKLINYSNWFSKVAIASVIFSIVSSIIPFDFLNQIVRSLFIERPELLDLAWIITIPLALLVIGLQSVIYYFSFTSIGIILLTLRDIEILTGKFDNKNILMID